MTLAMANQQPELFKAFGLFHSTAYADAEERKLSRNKVIEFVTNHGVKPFIESFIPPLFNDQSNQHILEIIPCVGCWRCKPGRFTNEAGESAL